MILVAIEGPSGSGKSTVIQKLKSCFEAHGYKVGVVDTNSGMRRDTLQRIAKKLSSSNPLRTLIFWIFRFREAKKIREIQYQYDLILADRYIGTPYVFSICSGIPERFVMWLYRMIHPKPDLTLFLKVSLLEVRKRKLSETNAKNKDGFSKILCSQYRYAARKFNWQPINASQTEEEVMIDCAAFIFEKMKK